MKLSKHRMEDHSEPDVNLRQSHVNVDSLHIALVIQQSACATSNPQYCI